jgi:hypothetical protein
MGWEHAARAQRLAPIGEYAPEVHRVTVHDTFAQYRLRMAALTIRNGMSVPEFFAFAADYVMAHHRKLKHFRKVFAKGRREILAAGREPIPGKFREPDSEQERRRRVALDRFSTWANRELHQDITGERL